MTLHFCYWQRAHFTVVGMAGKLRSKARDLKRKLTKRKDDARSAADSEEASIHSADSFAVTEVSHALQTMHRFAACRSSPAGTLISAEGSTKLQVSETTLLIPA